MSHFISSSVNYSETHILKSNFLSIILESYNEHILLNDSIKLNLDMNSKYIIPNNNVKYFMLIINKSDITPNNINNKYKICYFFTNNLTSNTKSDFYVEIDNNKTNFTKNNYLFEGYLYSKDNQNTFLISDILAIDSSVVKCDYSLRYSLIHKIISTQNLVNLNGHLSINIHSMFEITESGRSDDELFNIFKHNFIFKDSINSIEYIEEKSLKKLQKIIFSDETDSKKISKTIYKTKYIDVYDVKNIDTNDNEGILYIKTIKDSKKLYDICRDKIVLTCTFNHKFKKWQIV